MFPAASLLAGDRCVGGGPVVLAHDNIGCPDLLVGGRLVDAFAVAVGRVWLTPLDARVIALAEERKVGVHVGEDELFLVPIVREVEEDALLLETTLDESEVGLVVLHEQLVRGIRTSKVVLNLAILRTQTLLVDLPDGVRDGAVRERP